MLGGGNVSASESGPHKLVCRARRQVGCALPPVCAGAVTLLMAAQEMGVGVEGLAGVGGMKAPPPRQGRGEEDA